MRSSGLVLPAPLHALASRAAYRGTWFNLIVSYLPGPRTELYFGGARLEAVYPGLSLADEVGLAVGALQWGATIGVGISAESQALPDPSVLARALQVSYDQLAALVPEVAADVESSM
jgi:hypothetical protein